MSNFEMNADLYLAIQDFCSKGDRLANEREFDAAISSYNSAWELIPEPKNEWEASTWVLGAIADACFLGGYMGSAEEALEYAMTCPGGVGNPFLHLRFGQVLYERGKMERATQELMRAYMGEGEDIFLVEDKKYLDFLRSRVTL
ncbi:MAG: tetratricopeptide repeat protein [Achromobacter marplatensis]|uniref:tetratricopeptide repeat protein n=1 Tax=Achromobacter marplatensis TaxID=470868 RepID=UPI003D00B352